MTDRSPGPTRRALLACGVLGALPTHAAGCTVLTVATWPGLDIGAKAAANLAAAPS